MADVLKLRFRISAFVAMIAAAMLFAGGRQVAAQLAVETAQSAAEAVKVAATLPADSQAVLARLSGLRELPDGAWKMHAGDLAHGETVGLDESGWEAIALGGKAPLEAVWFRQTYVVPQTLSGYDLTGSRIWFQFHADANGPMPQILYFNGRRVAMGDDLEPIVLFDHAKPGDKVTVAVKLLHTVDVKTIRGASIPIEFREGRPNPTVSGRPCCCQSQNGGVSPVKSPISLAS
jgi:alpha-mannosidase